MKDYELLEKQAAMMRMAEKYAVDWKKLVVWKDHDGEWSLTGGNLSTSVEYKFALGVVEGKPVFAGDTGWSNLLNKSVVVAGFTTHAHWCYEGHTNYFDEIDLSWNPPKPKTVTVELLVEDAEVWSERYVDFDALDRLRDTCRKALEELK